MRIVRVVGRVMMGLLTIVAWILGVGAVLGACFGLLWAVGSISPIPRDWFNSNDGFWLTVGIGGFSLVCLLLIYGALAWLYEVGAKTNRWLARR